MGDNERSRLSQDVAAMQNAGSLTGRKKAAALAAGVKAQKALNQYNQCNVFWAPIDAEPLTAGGDGYVDGGNVDVSNFERDTYPSEPLTDGTYSEPKTVDSAPLTDDTYSEPKTAPQTVPSDPYAATAPLTDDSYSEPKTAPQTVDPYAESGAVKAAEETYTEDAADLTAEQNLPGPVY